MDGGPTAGSSDPNGRDAVGGEGGDVLALLPGDGGASGESRLCSESETEQCGPPNENGTCRFGLRTCVEGVFGACEGATIPAPRNCASNEDHDCDGVPDDTVDDVCACVLGSTEPCDEHPGLDGRGSCRAGTRRCTLAEDGRTTVWNDCAGSVGPAAADSCDVVGDDSNCDRAPNGGCECVDGVTIPCGPTTESGICQRGVSTCIGSAFSECVGAIFPERRNCASTADNDCDGNPDNVVDSACTCAVGASEVCGAHPGRDGNGSCQAGERACVLGQDNATSRFGACEGSVGPAAADSCNVLGDDSNCDQVENSGCDCIAGERSTCGAEHGSLGVCETRSLQCGSNGRWPTSASCAATSPEICTNNADDDCDGEVNEAEDCNTCVEGCFCEEGACAEIVALEMAALTACAMSARGNIWCWGDNRSGQAGLPGFTNEPRPRRLDGVTGARGITLGDSFACAIQLDQTVSCWGNGNVGQLGDNGATTLSFTPVRVLTAAGTPLAGIAKLEAGANFACALRGTDGAVLCWGQHVGNGTALGSPIAVEVLVSANVPLLRVADLQVGRIAALARQGTLWRSWGPSTGALGKVDTDNGRFATLIDAQPESGFASVAVEGDIACGLTAAGQAHCWGDDDIPLLAVGFGSGEQVTPLRVPALDGKHQIALSSRVGFVVDTAGAMRAFGRADEIVSAGVDRSAISGDPVSLTQVPGQAVKRVAIGSQSTCALQVDNTVRCWGQNSRGQIGNGTLTTTQVPELALPLP